MNKNIALANFIVAGVVLLGLIAGFSRDTWILIDIGIVISCIICGAKLLKHGERIVPDEKTIERKKKIKKRVIKILLSIAISIIVFIVIVGIYLINQEQKFQRIRAIEEQESQRIRAIINKEINDKLRDVDTALHSKSEYGYYVQYKFDIDWIKQKVLCKWTSRFYSGQVPCQGSGWVTPIFCFYDKDGFVVKSEGSNSFWSYDNKPQERQGWFYLDPYEVDKIRSYGMQFK